MDYFPFIFGILAGVGGLLLIAHIIPNGSDNNDTNNGDEQAFADDGNSGLSKREFIATILYIKYTTPEDSVQAADKLLKALQRNTNES